MSGLKTHLKVVFPNGRSELYLLEEEVDFNPVGYRVLVPLRSSQRGTTAVVVKKLLAKPSEDTLLIDSFPDRFPVINPVAVKVLKKNLVEYLTTLGESLFKLIPTWADWYQETYAYAVDKKPKGLPKSVLKIFEKLQKRGKVEYEKLKREFDPKVLRLLEEHHLLKIETRWVAPKVEEEFLKLSVKDREEILKRIERAAAKRREEVLRLLEIFEEEGEPLERERIKEFGISSQTIRYLIEKGILQRVYYNLPPFKKDILKEPPAVYEPLEPPDALELRNLPLERRIEKLLRFSEWVLSKGGDFLILLPGLELVQFFHKRFYEVFGDRAVVYAENLTQREKIKNWFRAAEDYGKIFITTPQWLFAPLKNPLALYLEDEGHPSYKMFRYPYFNLKRLAFEYAKLLNMKLVVSSEPPSVEQFLISKHFEVEEEKREPAKVLIEERNPFGDVLVEYLRRRGKHLILVPKRGYSNLKCRRCQTVLECPRCEVFLTLTKSGGLECPVCGFRAESKSCPRCGGETEPFGYGVERVKETLNFPIPGGDFNFSTHPPNFGNFDIVAVLFADGILSLPDFRKGEEFFRYLSKAKMRVKEGGLFILHTPQTEHHAVRGILEEENLFYWEEIELRKVLELPPFARLYLVAVNLKEEKEELAKKLHKRLKTSLKPLNVEVEFSKAPTFKLRERYRYQILVKLPLKVEVETLKKTIRVLKELKKDYPFVRVIPNPRSLV